MSGMLAESKEKIMLGKSNERRIHESTVKALKKARLLKDLSRKQLGARLSVTFKAVVFNIKLSSLYHF